MKNQGRISYLLSHMVLFNTDKSSLAKKQTIVDMTEKHPVNEILLANRRYHVIYTFPYRHIDAVHPSVESKQSAWTTRVNEFFQNISNISLPVWGSRSNLNGFEFLIIFYILDDCTREVADGYESFIELHGNLKLTMTSCPPSSAKKIMI